MPSSTFPGEVLVVEDPMIQKLIRQILVRHGYSVAGLSPSQAVEQALHGRGGFILITNTPAPFLELAETIPLLYISGYPDRQLAARFRHCRVLPKPFHPPDLLEAVGELAGVAVP